MTYRKYNITLYGTYLALCYAKFWFLIELQTSKAKLSEFCFKIFFLFSCGISGQQQLCCCKSRNGCILNTVRTNYVVTWTCLFLCCFSRTNNWNDDDDDDNNNNNNNNNNNSLQHVTLTPQLNSIPSVLLECQNFNTCCTQFKDQDI
jgi:hypothetical protein